MPLTNAEVDSAVPAAGEPNRALTNAALKEVITDIAAAITTAQARAGHTGTQTAATISDFNTAADARVAAAAATGSGNLVRDNGPVLTGATAAADPSAALGLATKQYVDGIAANLGKRQRVRAATTANITIATALNNADVLDGVTLATGDLVLVKDQTAPAENGVYVVGASPARAAEFDTYDEHPGSLIAVQEGTANADLMFLCTSNVGGTLNTTGIVFAANSAPTTAASVSVSDAGGYFAGTNVETVLQEVGADLATKVDSLAPVTISASTNLTRASHGNRLLICNSGSAINLTIEDDTTGAWEDGDFFAVLNIGAGTVTIQGDGTSSVTATPGYAVTIPQNGTGEAQRTGTNAWNAAGQLAVQAQATWEAGAGTTESVISPAKLAAAIAALAPAGGSSYGFQHEYKFWAEQSSTSTTAGQLPASHLASVVGTIASSGASYSTSYGAPRGVCTGSDAVVDSGVFVFRGKTTSAFFVPGATDSQQIIFEAVFACVDANAGRRWAEGLYINGGVAPAVNANPNSWVNVAIFGKDSGDSNIQVMTNDATSTAGKVDLGANFPATAGLYYARLVFTGGATRTLDYYIKRLDTGNVASGQITADLPVANTAGLTYITWGSNGPTTASAITFEHSYMRLAGRYTVG